MATRTRKSTTSAKAVDTAPATAEAVDAAPATAEAVDAAPATAEAVDAAPATDKAAEGLPPAPDKRKRPLSIREAADVLGVSDQTVRLRMKSGELDTIVIWDKPTTALFDEEYLFSLPRGKWNKQRRVTRVSFDALVKWGTDAGADEPQGLAELVWRLLSTMASRSPEDRSPVTVKSPAMATELLVELSGLPEGSPLQTEVSGS